MFLYLLNSVDNKYFKFLGIISYVPKCNLLSDQYVSESNQFSTFSLGNLPLLLTVLPELVLDKESIQTFFVSL